MAESEEAEKSRKEKNGPAEDKDERSSDAGSSEAIDPGQRPSLKDLVEIAEETNAMLLSLFRDPRINLEDPVSSPRPLFSVIDFVRRTYLEYILPLFPETAIYNVLELANPYVFAYPEICHTHGVFSPGFENDLARFERDDNWPEWTAELAELRFDAVGRNCMIALIIEQGDEKGPLVMGGSFDFEEDVRELVRGLRTRPSERNQVDWYREKLREVRRKAGIAG